MHVVIVLQIALEIGRAAELDKLLDKIGQAKQVPTLRVHEISVGGQV